MFSKALPSVRNIVVLAIVLAALVGGTWTIAKLTIEHLLYRDAVATGYSWANYLARHIEDLEQIVAGAKPSAKSMSFFERAQQVGHVFRYKIFDPQGRLRLVSDELSALGTDTQNLGEHNSAAARSIAAGNPLVTPKEGRPPLRPPFFSEAYVPVIVGGRVIAIVEAYVDQTEKRNDYRKSFTLAAVCLSFLTVFAFGAPAIAWHRRTREKQRADAHIHFLAYHDAMTSLSNRSRLVEQMTQAFGALPNGGLALHYIDVDHFKDINDTLGHDAGDQLIKTLAERLRCLISPDDVVARLGGDEFAVLQTRINGKDDAVPLARGIIAAMASPFVVNGHEISASASVGVALAPMDGSDTARLMKSADLALYRSKADGRNCIRFFTPEMESELEARLALETAIRAAVVNDGFELHFQPTIEMKRGRLVGFEALIRLRAPDGGLIPPADFIPVAEEMGLIDRIGAWVIREACRTAATWPDHLKVAVNLSPAQFMEGEGNIRDVVIEALAASSLEPHRLELEITEGLLLERTEAVMVDLGRLKDLGVAIVMDDFGTGYSSLSYLWRFPFDKIKIDRAFMQALDADDRNAETVVKTIIGLGKSLHIQVTVEGVENDRQLMFVRDAACDQVQGFYFSRPMPVADIPACILGNFERSLPDQIPSRHAGDAPAEHAQRNHASTPHGSR